MCFGMSCPHEERYSGECAFQGPGPYPCTEEADAPEEEMTDVLCPECLEDDDPRQLLFRDGQYRCPQCKKEYGQQDLMTALSVAAENFRKQWDRSAQIYDELVDLREKLNTIRKVTA